jgi:hypothetical protein
MNDQNRSVPQSPARGDYRQDKPIDLLDCIAYPTGATCPAEWCRSARGEWCQRNGVWCRWRNY